MVENIYFDNPLFMISIDTELIWGVANKPDHLAFRLMNSNLHNPRKSFYDLLDVLGKHNVPATWAIVGHLFLDKCQGHRYLSAPSDDWYTHDPCTDICRNNLYYGKDLIEDIISNEVKHEIGYHTFSHVDFSECHRNVAVDEIKEGMELAKDFGILLKSFVFPKNRIGHLDVIKENGFEIYRGKNNQRWNSDQNVFNQKMNGLIDKASAKITEPIWNDGIWEVPSSMQFIDPQIPYSLLPRAELGIKKAIAKRKIFHIYLHPYDLLIQRDLIKYLDRFLGFVSKKANKEEIQIMTMGDVAAYLNRNMLNALNK